MPRSCAAPARTRQGVTTHVPRECARQGRTDGLGRSFGAAGALPVSIPAALRTSGCSTTITNRDPTGECFPTVVGQSLEKEQTEMPRAFAGKPYRAHVITH
jgi:hypothetical protein